MIEPVLDLSRLSIAALAAAWRSALPFPHVVIDGVLRVAELRRLERALAREPADRIVDDLYEMLATAEPPRHPRLQAFAESLGSGETLAAVSAVTGKAVGRADARGYAYQSGHYLLPHSDQRERQPVRAVAYAFYVAACGEGAAPLEGGELELYACDQRSGEIIAVAPAVIVLPQPNRLVLFDVSPVSLHQVREVIRGVRLSLAGWFYA